MAMYRVYNNLRFFFFFPMSHFMGSLNLGKGKLLDQMKSVSVSRIDSHTTLSQLGSVYTAVIP